MGSVGIFAYDAPMLMTALFFGLGGLLWLASLLLSGVLFAKNRRYGTRSFALSFLAPFGVWMFSMLLSVVRPDLPSSTGVVLAFSALYLISLSVGGFYAFAELTAKAAPVAAPEMKLDRP